MKRTLVSLALTGASALSGCTAYAIPGEDFVYTNRVSQVSNRDFERRIPAINHSGLEFVPIISAPPYVKAGELPFIGKPWGTEDSWQVLRRRQGHAFSAVDTEHIYTLPQATVKRRVTVIRDGKQIEEDQEFPATEVEFVSIVARRKDSPKLVSELSTRTITKGEWVYDIPTLEMDHDNNAKTPDEEFYAPYAKDTKGSIQTRFLIPVAGTDERVNTLTGKIVLRHEGGIHYFNKISWSDYLARAGPNAGQQPKSGATQGDVIVR